MQYIVEVVHGLAHTHKDDVGEAVEFGDGEYLVKNVGSRQVAVETLHPSDTETAPHLAPRLTGDT